MSARDHSIVRRVSAVAGKEVVDLMRDRRSVIVILVTAVAAGPLLLLLVMNLVASQMEKRRELTIPVIGIERAPALAAFFERHQATLVAAPANAEARIRTGDLDIVLEVDQDFAEDVAAGRAGKVRLIYDRSRDRARASIDETETLLRGFSSEWARGRLLLRGVVPDVVQPLQVEVRNLATPQSAGSLVLGLIAYYGLFASLMGAMAAAVDTTAGERERGSLEPLLTTPIVALELAVGKWLALVLLNFLVVTVTLGGFYLMLRYGPLPAVGIPFLFGLPQYGRFLVVLLPLILLCPAVLLYVGMRGRSVKEAQANVSVLLFVASIMPVAQMFMQRREPEWLSLVPVASQYSLLSRVLRGDALPLDAAINSALIPLLLAIAALLFTARLLSKEAVLASR